MVCMRYTGPKARYVLELPVPFISKSEKTGEIIFEDGVADVPEDVADALDKLLGKNSPFSRVNGTQPQPRPPVVEDTPASPSVVHKKWPTKSECQAYIDANQIHGKPRYFGRQTWIIKHAVSA